MRTKGAMEARRVILGEAVRNLMNLHCLTGARAVVRGFAQKFVSRTFA